MSRHRRQNHKGVCGKSQRDRHERCQPHAAPTALTNRSEKPVFGQGLNSAVLHYPSKTFSYIWIICAATVVEANPPASNQLQSRSVCNKSQASSRKRMLNLVSEVDTEEQLSKLRKLEIQGKFLEWTDVMHSDLTWRRLIFGMSDGELRFSLQAITNTTPTPDNLCRHGRRSKSACL